MNNCSFIGRVGRNAESRATQSGTHVLNWSMAVDSGYGTLKTTIWLDCALWGERGAKLAQYILKGHLLEAHGEIGTREHEGKTYLTLRVVDVTLIQPREGAQDNRPAPQQGAPPQAAPAPADMDDDIPF